MKKLIFSLLTLILAFTTSYSQNQINLNDTLPLYQNVLFGKLDNGLTYYVLKNSEPKNRAYLQLVVNAGSVLEEEDQKGLAHMCEHMAFNGTKNFPKKELINFLESIGMRFGADLNAYTSFDETVYMLEIPLDKEEYLQKGLLVLHDWASEVSYETEEINAERGVIFEEWRLGRGPEDRIRNQIFPIMLFGSKYANRLPIGDTSVFKYCPPDNLRRFYNDWYRPDLQAIVVVGDFDPVKVQKMIVDMFSSIPKRSTEKERVYPEIPNNDKPLVKVATDHEARISYVQVEIKHDLKPVVTFGDYKEDLIISLVGQIISTRLSDLTNKPNAPFSYCGAGYSEFIGKKDEFSLFAIVNPGKTLEAIKTLSVEIKRAKNYGFTSSELQLQKSAMLSDIKKQFDERNKISDKRWASMIASNFLVSKTPLPGFEIEYALYQYFLPQITLDEVNKMAKELLTDQNNIITFSGVSGKDVPTEDLLLAAFQSVKPEEVTPYEDVAINNNLISKEPQAGKVTDTQNDAVTGTTTWTLSNGIKVVLKPTDFKDNEILMRAFSVGGYTSYDLTDNLNAQNCANIASENGLGDFSLTDLQKVLASKNVQLSPFLDKYSEGFSGQSTKDDFVTMMQMVYLYFTAPRFDEDAFNSFIDKEKSILTNQNNNPQSVWSNQISKTLSNNNQYAQMLDINNIAQLNNKRAGEIFKQRFADPASFTFFIVGSFNADSLKPVVEKYLGSLPAVNNNEKSVDRGIYVPKGNVNSDVFIGQDEKSMVLTFLQGFQKNTYDNSVYMEAIANILSDSLIDQIREKKTWTYSISASPYMIYQPKNTQLFQIFYSCRPDRVDSINQEIVRIALNLSKTVLPQTEVDKTIEKIKRKHELDLRDNRFWIAKLVAMKQYNLTPSFITDFDKTVGTINADNIKKYAKKLVKGTYISIALKPKKQ